MLTDLVGDINKTVTIYTDGSANNETKLRGGVGIVLKYKEHQKQVSLGQYIQTTSARMELRGAIEGLKLITNKKFRVRLYCDNIYCVRSHSDGWMESWEQGNWIGRKNADLLKQLLFEIRLFPKGFVEFIHIKGHQKGDSEGVRMNNLCDKLASQGGKFSILIDDSEEKRGI